MKITNLPHLPSSTGVYQFFAKSGKILYIGKAKDLSKRVRQYFSPWSVWKIDMVQQAHRVEYIQTRSEEEALLLEEQLIKQYLPEYNRLLKHNSNYVWIKYSNEEFPRVSIVRKRNNDGSTYIWPKQRSRRLYDVMKYLRRLIKYRTMSRTHYQQWVIDMDYHLWLDEWWSLIHKLDHKNSKRIEQAKKIGINTQKTKEEWQVEYQQRLDLLQQFLEWKTAMLLDTISSEIQEHVEKQNFERCAQLRDIYEHIQLRDQRYQSIVLQKPRTGKVWWISTIQKYFVVIIIIFTEGKIVDIIREKSSTSDKDIHQLKLELETEFGLKSQSIKSQSTGQQLLASKRYIRLPKNDKKSLTALHQKFLDSYITSQVFGAESIMSDLLSDLQSRYDRDHIPYHMECIDISHMSGDRVSWGLSCMINGLPSKRWYRHYKIREALGGDDYASLTEVIERRFGLKNKNPIEANDLPDVFILDGGKGQLGILRGIIKKYPQLVQLMQQVQFVALGKGEARSRKWKNAGAVEELYR